MPPTFEDDETLHDASLALRSPDVETRCLAALKIGHQGRLDGLAQLETSCADPEDPASYFARIGRDLLMLTLRAERGSIDGERIEELHHQLESPYIEERCAAIRELNVHHLPESTAPLVACLMQENDPAVVVCLARVLLSYNDATHRDLLLPGIDSPDPRIRAGVTEGFWGWDDPAVARKTAPLVKDPSAAVRSAALILAVRRNDASSRGVTEKLLQASQPWMRLAAIYALAGVHDEWAHKQLSAIVSDEEQPKATRTLAREAIAISGAHGTEQLRAARSAADPTVRTDLTRHLPPLPNAEALRRALQSSDPTLRIHGLQNVARFGPGESLPVLTRLVDWEKDEIVLASLVKALVKIGGPEVAPRIEKLLDHDSVRVRSNALEALATVKRGAELQAHCKRRLVEDDAPRVRSRAAAILFEESPEEATRHFRTAIVGQDPAGREGALLILANLKDDRLLGVLEDALGDPRREVYGECHRVLESAAQEWPGARTLLESYRRGEVVGEVVDGEPVAALLVAMNSSRTSDRIRAISKLVHAQDPRVNVVLELNLASRDHEVRREAGKALARRHRAITLPGLFRRLGELHDECAASGLLPLPRSLVREIARLHAAGGHPQEVHERTGKTIFAAFEDDLELDFEFRSLCLEIRAAYEQMRQVAVPEADAVAEALAAVGDTDAGRALGEALASGDLEQPDEESPGPRGWIRTGAVVGLAAAAIGAFVLSGDRGDPEASASASPADEGPVTVERSIAVLDAMSLEPDPIAFSRRFMGRRVVILARLEQLVSPGEARIRAGSVAFSVTSPRAVPAALKVGSLVEATCAITGLARDGTISTTGELRTAKGP